LNREQVVGYTIPPDDSVKINVRFTPLSEYPPYGNCPVVDSFFVNFRSGPAAPGPNTKWCVLKGRGILPKIATQGFVFPDPVEVDTTKNSNDYEDLEPAQINSISFTADLQIRRITKLPNHEASDFAIDEITITDNLILNRAFDPPNVASTYQINNIEFTPSSTDPVIRRCWLEVESDAIDGPGPSYVKLDTIEIRGTAFDAGFTVYPADYGKITRCDTPTSSIIIENESTTNELKILDIIIDDYYKDVLIRLTDITDLTIPPNTPLPIQYRFQGCNLYDPVSGAPFEGKLVVPVTVVSNIGSQETTISVEPVIIPVTIHIPTFSVFPGDTKDFMILISLTHNYDQFLNFTNAGIVNYEMVLDVKRNELFFDGRFSPAQPG